MKCPMCQQNKGEADFPRDKNRKSGLNVYCRACEHEKRKAIRQRRRTNGLCWHCDKPAVIGTLCQYHWFGSIAGATIGRADKRTIKFLIRLWEQQNKKCPYTGQSLVPGGTMTLDHVMPVSRFPQLKAELSNLQWVSWTVNRMKADMTSDEFIALCAQIAVYTQATPSTDVYQAPRAFIRKNQQSNDLFADDSSPGLISVHIQGHLL